MNGGHLVLQALTLDPHAFAALDQGLAGLRLSLVVVFLAGVSQALGQSVVLFANRVSQRRFLLSLLVSGVIFIFVYLFWSTSLWLIAAFVFGHARPYLNALRTVGLAYSPQLFGLLVLTPYFGTFVAASLSVWNLLAIVVASRTVFHLSALESVAAAALGWMLLQLLQRTIGRPVLGLGKRLRVAVAGRRLVPLTEVLEEERGL
ncbi:MAG TPA: hypothetical protein VKA00_06435 [Trueperaceae bacterium]|nr:hypothetical protein [Trueperaceae bacterium]